MSNKEVEEKAINLILKYLKERDIRAERVKNSGYDIKTPNIKIEVKSRGNRNKILGLNYSNINAFEMYDNIELWAVIGVKTKKPELMKFKKSEVVDRKKERRMWRFYLNEEDYSKSIKL